MLSFVEPSCDWPLTSGAANGRFTKNYYNQFRRSMSMPSDSSSEPSSERNSPVEEIKFEDVFAAPQRKEEKKVEMDKGHFENEITKAHKKKKKVRGKKDSTNECGEKNKKKWMKLELSDCGFNTSLLPRPSMPSSMNEEEVHSVLDKIDNDFLELDAKMAPYDHLDRLEGNRIENRYLRDDRDRKIRKAHKQIKDKYCLSVRNNDGRKKLYVHHRVMRLMQLEAYRAHLHFPMPPKKNQPDYMNKSSTYTTTSSRSRSAPVQNLAHALHNTNSQLGDLPTDLISLLISLQHRDISPEDYDVLLRLDESVAPKTVSENQLESFKTDTVDESSAGGICSVCMDPYVIGQKRKFLPCDHVFHDSCIDMWLKNSSMNCPLDGLPVDS